MVYFSIYPGAPLFDLADRQINLLLLEHVLKQLGSEQYRLNLPQLFFDESTDAGGSFNRFGTMHVKEVHLLKLCTSTLSLMRHDGSETDCGVAWEQAWAEMLCIPSVLIRSDFRLAGEGHGKFQVNLMLAAGPETSLVECLPNVIDITLKYGGGIRSYEKPIDLAALQMERHEFDKVVDAYASLIASAFENLRQLGPKLSVEQHIDALRVLRRSRSTAFTYALTDEMIERAGQSRLQWYELPIAFSMNEN
jgi:hypothetical protein